VPLIQRSAHRFRLSPIAGSLNAFSAVPPTANRLTGVPDGMTRRADPGMLRKTGATNARARGRKQQ